MAIDARQGFEIGLSFRRAGRLLPALVLAALGCTEPAVETVELAVDNWWQRPSETEAFLQVKTLHEGAHENVSITAIPRSKEAPELRVLTAQKLLAGRPPSTFQANIGADLLRWAVVNTEDGEPSTRRIHGLVTLFEKWGLNEELPESLLRQLRVGGSTEPFGVPINIHRENVLYYSQKKLDDFTAAHPYESFLEAATLCPEVIPEDPEEKLDANIAMSPEGWVLVLFAFENVLVSVAGPEFYQSLFRGEYPLSASGLDWTDDVRKALRCVQYLSRSFDRINAIDDWSEALTAVQNDQASFTVIGDWANGELTSQLASGAVNAVPFPGSEEAFVFTSDTFPLPAGVEHGAEVFEFLETIASPRAQLGFSEKKGSIPALRSVSLVDHPRAAKTREQFDAATQVVATSGLFPPYFPETDLHEKLQNMVAEDADRDDIEAVIAELSDDMPLLERWQTRLTQPAGVLP
jgi:glucose/mannose transport system substrate-binding protein